MKTPLRVIFLAFLLVSVTVQAGHINSAAPSEASLRASLAGTSGKDAYQKRKAAAHHLFDTYCSSGGEKVPVSADLVEAIARKASNTDEMIAYYLLRTLGSMGGHGSAALPILEGGVTATPRPERFLAGVDVGQPVDIDQTLQLVMTAIRNDKPMSCDLRKPY